MLLKSEWYIKQILHTTVFDIKVYYYPRNAIFHEAAGRVEYCHSSDCNKPDIKHGSVQYLFYYIFTCIPKLNVPTCITCIPKLNVPITCIPKLNVPITCIPKLNVPITCLQQHDGNNTFQVQYSNINYKYVVLREHVQLSCSHW